MKSGTGRVLLTQLLKPSAWYLYYCYYTSKALLKLSELKTYNKTLQSSPVWGFLLCVDLRNRFKKSNLQPGTTLFLCKCCCCLRRMDLFIYLFFNLLWLRHVTALWDFLLSTHKGAVRSFHTDFKVKETVAVPLFHQRKGWSWMFVLLNWN